MRFISIHSMAVLAAVSLAAFGCSSDDSSGAGGGAGTQSGGGGGAGKGGTGGSTGKGGSTASGGSVSSGGSVATGGGGAAGMPAGGGAAGTPASGGAAGMPASGGTGGGASGACTNADDQAKLNAMNVGEVVGGCAKDNLGGEPGTKTCIKTKTNLSDACVDCFDQAVQCGAKNCWLQCISDSNSPDCIACRAQFCDPAFAACSGLTGNP